MWPVASGQISLLPDADVDVAYNPKGLCPLASNNNKEPLSSQLSVVGTISCII
jgi:hypothetical protein